VATSSDIAPSTARGFPSFATIECTFFEIAVFLQRGITDRTALCKAKCWAFGLGLSERAVLKYGNKIVLGLARSTSWSKQPEAFCWIDLFEFDKLCMTGGNTINKVGASKQRPQRPNTSSIASKHDALTLRFESAARSLSL